MWEELGKAACLVLIFEGILPFLYPRRWRQLVVTLAKINDRQLRVMGFFTMALGVVLLFVINA